MYDVPNNDVFQISRTSFTFTHLPGMLRLSIQRGARYFEFRQPITNRIGTFFSIFKTFSMLSVYGAKSTRITFPYFIT